MVETFLNKYCARDDHSQKSIVLVFIIRMLRLFETVLSAPAAHGFLLRQQSKNRAVFFIFLSKVLAAGELCAIIKQHAEQFVLLHKMN